jgi:hypothetical protein
MPVSFTNSDLTLGVLTITHAMGNIPFYVLIMDNNGKNIVLDDSAVTFSNNSIAVDLTSYGTLTGTWKYRLI